MDLTKHHQELNDVGFTIVENIIDLNFIEELIADVARLEQNFCLLYTSDAADE